VKFGRNFTVILSESVIRNGDLRSNDNVIFCIASIFGGLWLVRIRCEN